jgi:hypothetical protein
MDEIIEQEKIIGYSPKAVKVHALGLKAVFIPFFGIFFGVAALIKSRSAKREILHSDKNLIGYDLCRKGITYAVLSFVSLLFNITIIGVLIWGIQQIPTLIENPSVQNLLQDGTAQILTEFGGTDTLDLQKLGLSDANLDALKAALPEGTDINSLTISDILELAKQYGIG